MKTMKKIVCALMTLVLLLSSVPTVFADEADTKTIDQDQVLANLGFQTGNILEPSCGVGNFMGLLPENMGSSKMYGVELDSISGRIAQHGNMTEAI